VTDEGPPSTARFLPVLPLRNSVLFPHQVMPLAVGRPRSINAVEAALVTEEKVLILVPQKSTLVEDPVVEDLHNFGTIAVIKRMERATTALLLFVQGISRAEFETIEDEGSYFRVKPHRIPHPEDTGPEIDALRDELIATARRILAIVEPDIQPVLERMVEEVDDPLYLAYALAPFAGLDLEKEKTLFTARSRIEALRLMHAWLKHHAQVVELRAKIASDAATELTRQQREAFLRQQLQEIQEQLGGASPEEAEVAELRRRLGETDLPPDIQRELEKELVRLERMRSAAPDYQVTRTYVELVLELPWRRRSEDSLDLVRAREVLDEDHFDLDDVKSRILEHLAVMKLNPDARAPILCFVGPPGVGKTSVGQSIARALGRKFERMSLGGLHDEAELRGHRRTYIGAMPGRLIQAIRRAGVSNPVLMLDEVDKLGRDYRGDPAAALMEILDPAQNVAFRDNYLDLPFDLSAVFFITTANTLESIPRPLLDRMEVLRLAGYSDDEKAHIAQRYLIPRQISQAGIDPDKFAFTNDALPYIIRRYTREAGVRELDRALARMFRKLALQFAEGHADPIRVGKADIAEFLGPERFFEESARRELQPGVVAGLAWTESGGEVLYVEAVLLPDDKEMTLTGHLGGVMQESARAARSLIRAQADRLGLDPKTTGRGVHIHVPSGAIPKDGPSAGVAMFTALTSAYAGQAVRSDIAMTGEITLSGLVLPVGGIKEKVLAAHRAGIRCVMIPRANEKDLRDLPDNLRNEVDFILVERAEDIIKNAIPQLVPGASGMD